MDGLDATTLLRPYWLIALPVIALLAWRAWRRHANMGDWTRAIDAHLMQAMDRLGRMERSGARVVGLGAFLAAGAIALALTGPAVKRGEGRSFRNLDGVVFAFDLSRSMTEDRRWQDVVTIARAGLTALGTRPAALVVYAGDSYEAAALTTDHLQLGQTVALLDAETVPDAGSRPALGLKQAGRMLARAEILAGDVVLFTDGAGIDAETLRAAQSITQAGARLVIVQARTDRADAEAIATLRRETSADLLAVGEIDRFMDLLSEDTGKRLQAQDFELAIWTDQGRFLLILALIPLAGLFRREQA